jgi:hypothetical protein
LGVEEVRLAFNNQKETIILCVRRSHGGAGQGRAGPSAAGPRIVMRAIRLECPHPGTNPVRCPASTRRGDGAGRSAMVAALSAASVRHHSWSGRNCRERSGVCCSSRGCMHCTPSLSLALSLFLSLAHSPPYTRHSREILVHGCVYNHLFNIRRRSEAPRTSRTVHGYLTHKKQRPPRTLQ